MRASSLPEEPFASAPGQAALAALDALEDDALWRIAHGQRSAGDVTRLEWLLEEHADNALRGSERLELETRMAAADAFLRRKAYAAVLLQRRGYDAPQSDEA
ncbi:MAG: hypothetical protein IAE81_22540 [Caldilineaceae bacterium]|jgi:hypothetical protein|nr:hypothetical protein [Caldilineaceae bacterium]